MKIKAFLNICRRTGGRFPHNQKHAFSPDMRKRVFLLLGHGPISIVEFFVFRKTELWKQKNHLLCR